MIVDFREENFCGWEMTKALFILSVANVMEINLSSYGELAVNNNSGYTYLWLEDYGFTLYMPINCKLEKSEIYVSFLSNLNNDEIERPLTEFDNLYKIEKWIEQLQKVEKVYTRK